MEYAQLGPIVGGFPRSVTNPPTFLPIEDLPVLDTNPIYNLPQDSPLTRSFSKLTIELNQEEDSITRPIVDNQPDSYYIGASNSDMANNGILALTNDFPLVLAIEGDQARLASMKMKPDPMFFNRESIPVMAGIDDLNLDNSNEQLEYVKITDKSAKIADYKRSLLEAVISNHEVLLPRLLMCLGFPITYLSVDEAITLCTWTLACQNLGRISFNNLAYLSSLQRDVIATISQDRSYNDDRTLFAPDSSADYTSRLWSLSFGMQAPSYDLIEERLDKVTTYPLRIAYWLSMMYPNFYESCTPIYQWLASRSYHPLEDYVLYLGEDSSQWPSKMMIIREKLKALIDPGDQYLDDGYSFIVSLPILRSRW